MSEVSISVLSDPDPRHIGEAILRLTGVALVPPGSTYRIDPVAEDETVEVPAGWPSGELRPCAQRITRDGVDLVISADVVEAAALLPGTPVAISVPAVGARAELKWPSLRECGPARQESGAVIVSEMAAELAVRAAVKLAAGARADLERLEMELAATAGVEAEEAERRIIAALVRNLGDDGALSSLTLAPDIPPKPWASASASRDEVLASLKPVSELRPAEPRKAPLPTPQKPVPSKPLTVAAPVALEVVPPPPMPTVRQVTPSAGAMGDASARSRASRSPWPVVAAFVLGCMLAGAAAVVAPISASRLASLTAPSIPKAAEASVSAPVVGRGLADILAVPESSPSGEPAGQVGLEEALRRADQSLTGTNLGDPDRREAKFWLRKALSASLGDERLLWAITQLGTLYASPEGEAADFASARALWELAAAKDDPVALCFLASLFEAGLGVAKNAPEALSLYQRAKAHGGCRDVDAAISRLTKAPP